MLRKEPSSYPNLQQQQHPLAQKHYKQVFDKQKIHTSSGLQPNIYKTKTTGGPTLKKSMTSSGLPPISLSNPSLSKTQMIEKNLKGVSMDSLSREIPPWRI
jgi:hypothetical protein